MPLFAAEDWHLWIAGAVGSALTAAFAGLMKVLGWLGQRRDAAERLEDQRRHANWEETQKIIRWLSEQVQALTEAHEECRRESTTAHTNIAFLHTSFAQLCEALRRDGKPSPEVRPLEAYLPSADLEARSRQLRQNTALLMAHVEKVVPGPRAGGEKGGP